MLKLHLDLIETLEGAVAELDAQLGEALAPFHEAVARVHAVPGIDIVVPRAILGEIGLDMSRFERLAFICGVSCGSARLGAAEGCIYGNLDPSRSG